MASSRHSLAGAVALSALVAGACTPVHPASVLTTPGTSSVSRPSAAGSTMIIDQAGPPLLSSTTRLPASSRQRFTSRSVVRIRQVVTSRLGPDRSHSYSHSIWGIYEDLTFSELGATAKVS